MDGLAKNVNGTTRSIQAIANYFVCQGLQNAGFFYVVYANYFGQLPSALAR
jgi:hypothetical protein